MIILTDAEYKRRIEEARQQGWKERSDMVDRDQFQETIWKAIQETRKDLDRQIRAICDALVKTGMEDPLALPKTRIEITRVRPAPGDPGY